MINYAEDIESYKIEEKQEDISPKNCFDFEIVDLKNMKHKFCFTKLETWVIIKNLEAMIKEIENKLESETSEELSFDILFYAYFLEDFRTLYSDNEETESEKIAIALESSKIQYLIKAFEISNPSLIKGNLDSNCKYLPHILSLYNRFQGFERGLSLLI